MEDCYANSRLKLARDVVHACQRAKDDALQNLIFRRGELFRAKKRLKELEDELLKDVPMSE